MPAVPALDIVIVTAAGSLAHVRACLDSIAEHPLEAGSLSVHVVDNASRDGTVRTLRAEYPWVRVTELDANAGFARANNVALRDARAPLCLVLNPDTKVGPGALDFLCALAHEHPRAAAVGCRLVDAAGKPDHNAKRSVPRPVPALLHFSGLSRLEPLRRRFGSYAAHEIPDEGAGSVDAISGACMLVRRAAIEEVGLLDEAYWMYGEDLDWCQRFRLAGWEIRYDGSRSVYHAKHGVSGRHRSLRQQWAFHRAMGRFYRKFVGGRRPLVDAAVYLALILKFGAACARSGLARARAARAADR